MRLLSLDLERYGPFTGRSLRFRDDARLHVVLGANEAGKTSALAALTDLLFGIEARTPFAFLHPMPELRIGADIVARDGRRLALRRRKGNRNTLVDAADAPLPEDALAPFLGGLTVDVFRHAFGLTSAALRRGGEEMLRSEGELGASLAAAASGLRGYSALQKGLDAEADRIFAPRASQQRSFYQALTRYEDARKAARAGELRAGDWRQLNEAIAAAGERLTALKAAGEARAAERARLERLRRAGPLLAAIDALAARLAEDGALEALPHSLSDAWTDKLGEHLAAQRRAAEAETVAASALAEATAELEAVVVDEALLPRADEIGEAVAGIVNYEKAGIDIPRVAADEDRHRRALAGIAARIGLPPEALAERLPPDAARIRVATLAADGRSLVATLARLEGEHERRRAEMARLAAPEGGDAPQADPAPLRADLRVLAPLRAEIARLDDIDAAILRANGPLLGAAARLSPPVLDLSSLARLPLPSAEAIARFRREIDARERACGNAREAVSLAGRAVAAARVRFDEIEGGRPVPSPEALGSLRAERDGLLAALKPALGSGAPAPEGALERFEQAQGAADRAADALAEDAVRVAEHAQLRRRLALEKESETAAAARLVEAQANLDATEASWRAAWEPTGIAAASPAEMASWRGEAETLVGDHEAIETQRLERADLAARIEDRRAPLTALAARAGLSDLGAVPLTLLLDRIEARVTSLAELWEAGRNRQAAARAQAEEIARIEAEIASARQASAIWAESWTGALSLVGLRADASPQEAEGALAAWNEVPAAMEALSSTRQRIAGMHRDRGIYADRVARLVEDIASDLGDRSPSAAARALQARLREADDGATRRKELNRRRDVASRALAVAQETAAAAGAAFADHLAGAGPAAAACEAADLHARLSDRRRLRGELAAERGNLARIADGVPEAVLREERARLPTDEIEARLHRIAAEHEESEEAGRLAFAERQDCERRRQIHESGLGAELALAERRAAEAEIQAAAREWAVVRLASLMLGGAIGRHRAGRQDPLVARAGTLFAGLTGGAFGGLAQDYDEADEPRIAGRRASGERVPMEGLSEGTRDQLYLALRLAYLEDYAARAEPAPFVGDDLFLTFDDARTGHGLEALAAIGETIQPILFTHHAHVAGIARARLGERVEILEL